jgi:hypothetical protein
MHPDVMIATHCERSWETWLVARALNLEVARLELAAALVAGMLCTIS